jgi:hypothetical protein
VTRVMAGISQRTMAGGRSSFPGRVPTGLQCVYCAGAEVGLSTRAFFERMACSPKRLGLPEPMSTGSDLFVEAEVLFDRADADFKLETFVDLMLFELGQLGADSIEFAVELVDTAVERVSDAARSSLVAMCLTTWASISPISLRVIFLGAICGKV